MCLFCFNSWKILLSAIELCWQFFWHFEDVIHYLWPPQFPKKSTVIHITVSSMWEVTHFSWVQLFVTYGLQSSRLLCPWDSPGKNAGVGCHALLQGSFLTQGSSPCFLRLLHRQADSFPVLPPGKPLTICSVPFFFQTNFEIFFLFFWFSSYSAIVWACFQFFLLVCFLFTFGFTELLESLNLCVLPNMEKFQPWFLQIYFSTATALVLK